MTVKTGKLSVPCSKRKIKTKSLVQDYEIWIEESEWDICTTFTKNEKLGMKGTRELCERFYPLIRERFPNARYLWIAEPHDVATSYHTHGLLFLGQPHSEKCKEEIRWLKEQWRIYANGGKGRGKWTKLMPYTIGGGWARYLAYKMNRHNVDWELHKPPIQECILPEAV